MGDIGIRYYFFDGDKIMKVGIDTKKLFPALAGRQVPWVTVTFKRSTREIRSIRFDPANINTAGEWNFELEGKYIVQTIEEIFSERPDNVTSLRHRSRITLTDSQKEILRNRIDRDFGSGSWASIPPNNKALLWSTGRTFN